MRLPLARGSGVVLGPLALVTLIAARLHPVVGGVAAGLLVFSLYFFRDFERAVPSVPSGEVLAAADGKILSIQEVFEDSYVGGPCLRISTFMSLFDVHVNRAPVEGEVELLRHTPGGFAMAFADDAAESNERYDVGIRTGGHKILARQVSGFVARRIICRLRVGARPRQGDRYGLIRFGSRLDLFLPLGSEPLVEVGQQVYAGLTSVARLPGEGA